MGASGLPWPRGGMLEKGRTVNGRTSHALREAGGWTGWASLGLIRQGLQADGRPAKVLTPPFQPAAESQRVLAASLTASSAREGGTLPHAEIQGLVLSSCDGKLLAERVVPRPGRVQTEPLLHTPGQFCCRLGSCLRQFLPLVSDFFTARIARLLPGQDIRNQRAQSCSVTRGRPKCCSPPGYSTAGASDTRPSTAPSRRATQAASQAAPLLGEGPPPNPSRQAAATSSSEATGTQHKPGTCSSSVFWLTRLISNSELRSGRGTSKSRRASL